MAFGGFERSTSGAPAAEINMVPLIDVMLVLLVIFIVAAPMLTHSVPVQLPQASASPAPHTANSVSVSIAADGTLHWEGRVLSRSDLQVSLQRQAVQAAETELRLHADQAVPYGVVATVLADANRAGLNRIAFISEPALP